MMNWSREIIACAKFKLSEIPSKGGTAHMVRNSIRAGKKITLINLNEGN